jgi:hypothetical protein
MAVKGIFAYRGVAVCNTAGGGHKNYIGFGLLTKNFFAEI